MIFLFANAFSAKVLLKMVATETNYNPFEGVVLQYFRQQFLLFQKARSDFQTRISVKFLFRSMQ